jgi:hypothetical protein
MTLSIDEEFGTSGFEILPKAERPRVGVENPESHIDKNKNKNQFLELELLNFS